MKGFRTISFASILAILGLLQQGDFINLIPDDYRGIFVAVIGCVVAILRLMTKTPVGTSE